MKRIILSILFILSIKMMMAQEFTQEEIRQGYAQQGNTTHFLFSPKSYKVSNISKVVVTGSFRAWSHDLDDKKWNLKEGKNGLWTVAVENKDFKKIPTSAEFKFRINDKGEWLNPPADAPNEKGGNLVFMKGMKPPTLKAEIRRPRTVWAKIEGVKRSINPADYLIKDTQGKKIKVAKVMPNTASETLIIPAEDLDPKKPYYLEIPKQNLKTVCSFDGWFREMYSDKELGANISEDGESTTFRVFAPRAEALKLYLYKKAEDEKGYCTIEMEQDAQGVWETIVPENLNGIYYDFTVHGAKAKGNMFYETHPVHISDPYARVSMDSWGKCRVVPKTKPATPLKNGIPPMQDVIAYEVHVQDFTDLLPVSEELKGTIPAMTQTGLRNSRGEKIGFDYLVDLGINVVHLMPMQEYLHWSDEDWQATFANDEFMKEQGIAEENYQWGYRTTHCFAVETRFRPKGKAPGTEREMFRDLVQAFHDKNIAVIIDIVPNHTGENMDGQEILFHFNALDKQYYYRTKDLEHIGEYGNEVKTENRPMVQRWLIDQCKHWIEEFGIDGFRIDLAGQIDQQTLEALKTELGEDIIVYGEPWIGSNDPEYEANPDWDWYKVDSPITFFQDDARNAFKGPVFDIKDPKTDRGWAGGKFDERENVMKGLANTFPEDKSPQSGINYLDIHDNWALADQFASKNWDGRMGVEEDRFKIAALLLYTSQGPIVTHGGTEMMRSKGAAELKETVKRTKQGVPVYMHGKRDTYNMRVANQFVWENVGKTTSDKDIYCDYKGMFAFWKGLNKLRLSKIGKVFRNAESVSEDYYRWITPQNTAQLGYFVNDKVLVLINADDKTQTFENITFPAGKWKLIANNSEINQEKGAKDSKEFTKIKGGKTYTFNLAKTSFKVWVKE